VQKLSHEPRLFSNPPESFASSLCHDYVGVLCDP
jgi:hypothetical protein